MTSDTMRRNLTLLFSTTLLICLGLFLTFIYTTYDEEDPETMALYLMEEEYEYDLSENQPINLHFDESEITTYITSDKEWKYQAVSYNGDSWPNSITLPKPSLCMATHSTLDRLHWLGRQSTLWKGLISVSVFVRYVQAKQAVKILGQMLTCSPEIRQYVKFTIVFKEDIPPFLFKPIDVEENVDCAKIFNVFNDDENINADVIYPQNMMRNIARKGCPTTHTINMDVDMISKDGMADDLLDFLQRTPPCPKCFYIVPVYEIAAGEQFPPMYKEDLLNLVQNNKSRPFHIQVYRKNQGPSDLDRWQREPSKSLDEVNILYEVTKYREKWEPIGLLHHDAPGFIERFIGYGNTRSSHIFLLHTKGFQFYLLDNVFISHYGFQTKENRTEARWKQMKYSKRLYKQIKKEILKSARKEEEKKSQDQEMTDVSESSEEYGNSVY